MAESGLSIGAPDLRAEIGYFLNYGRLYTSWSTDQLTEINAVMQSGVRRVYYPPAVLEENAGYEWSFLRPFTTLPTVIGTGDYDLPDDLGRLVDVFHYPAEEYKEPVVVIPVRDLLRYRAGSSYTGFPRYAAERWKSTDGTTGQRKEVLFWPTPNAVWTLGYQYEAYNGPLTDTYPYPLGGMKLAELFIESCLAVAEQRMNDDAALHTEAFKALLIDAIARDKNNGAQVYGQMGHYERLGPDAERRCFRRGDSGSTYSIYYKGSPV
jgi:hypothetical protein